MKSCYFKSILFTLVSFNLSLNVSSQEYDWHTEAIKKVEVIKIITDDSLELSFNKCMNILKERQVPIISANEKYYTISAGPKFIGGPFVGDTYINIYILKDSLTFILMSGYLQSPTANGTKQNFKLQYRGVKNSPAMESWTILQEIAKSYKTNTIYYGVLKK